MKKILLLLVVLISVSAARASDTLTVGQVFNFNVGDTFDYQLYIDENPYPPYYPQYIEMYSRCIVTGKTVSSNNDSIWYTITNGTITTTTLVSGLDSSMYYLDTPAACYDFYSLPYIPTAPSFASFNIVTGACNDTFNLYNDNYFHFDTFGPPLTFTDSAANGISLGGFEWGREIFHQKGLGFTYEYTPTGPDYPYSYVELIYYSKGNTHAGTPYYILEGVSDIINTSIKLFPNPTTDLLTLSLGSISSNYQFTLTDFLGKGVYSQPVSQTETTVDISHLASGIYIWRLTTADGTVRTGKVVKE